MNNKVRSEEEAKRPIRMEHLDVLLDKEFWCLVLIGALILIGH